MNSVDLAPLCLNRNTEDIFMHFMLTSAGIILLGSCSDEITQITKINSKCLFSDKPPAADNPLHHVKGDFSVKVEWKNLPQAAG